MKKILLLIIILIVSSCQKTHTDNNWIPQTVGDMVACGTEEDEAAYELSEVFFKEDEVLTFRLNIVYFTNQEQGFDSTYFFNRIKEINAFFADNKTGIQFKLSYLNIVHTSPIESNGALPYIEKIEKLKNDGEKFENLREKFTLNHFKFWHLLYGKKNTINLYVFQEPLNEVAGQSGGIGSVFCAVNFNFINKSFNSDVHELGHCLGLLHTHTQDKTNGYNSFTGDKVCDTPASPNLLGLVNSNCELYKDYQDRYNSFINSKYENDPKVLAKLPKDDLRVTLSNIMSYSYPNCRIEFTEEQIRRMRKTIETSSDLRNCVEGIENLNLDFINDLN